MVDAATFKTEGSFVDFYSDSTTTMIGEQVPRGSVVYRVSQDLVADIQEVPDSE